jgi:hypothetical protein
MHVECMRAVPLVLPSANGGCFLNIRSITVVDYKNKKWVDSERLGKQMQSMGGMKQAVGETGHHERSGIGLR